MFSVEGKSVVRKFIEGIVNTGVNINRVVDGLIVEHGGAANLFGPLLEAGVVCLSKDKPKE